jgi:hypothetical protein
MTQVSEIATLVLSWRRLLINWQRLRNFYICSAVSEKTYSVLYPSLQRTFWAFFIKFELQVQRRSNESMTPCWKLLEEKESCNLERRLFHTHVHMNFFIVLWEKFTFTFVPYCSLYRMIQIIFTGISLNPLTIHAFPLPSSERSIDPECLNNRLIYEYCKSVENGICSKSPV